MGWRCRPIPARPTAPPSARRRWRWSIDRPCAHPTSSRWVRTRPTTRARSSPTCGKSASRRAWLEGESRCRGGNITKYRFHRVASAALFDLRFPMSNQLHVFADNALEMRRYKLAVLPIGRDRRPRVSGFSKWSRLPSERTVARWTEQYAADNIGIIPGLSNLFVADCDDASQD